jgi:hypothetical protein
MLSLAGHAAFGVILGVVYAIAGPRRYYRYRYRDRAFGLVAVAARRRRRRKRDDDEDYVYDEA